MVGRRSTIFPYISLKPFLSNFPVAPNIITQDDIKKKKRNECQRSLKKREIIIVQSRRTCSYLSEVPRHEKIYSTRAVL